MRHTRMSRLAHMNTDATIDVSGAYSHEPARICQSMYVAQKPSRYGVDPMITALPGQSCAGVPAPHAYATRGTAL